MIKSSKKAPSKKRNTIISLALAGAIAITGAFAYLTATDTATNMFTVGNVVVELTEPNWSPDVDSDGDGINDTMSNIVAGQKIAKDPTLTNSGDNNAYGYIMVEIPKVYETDITGDDGAAVSQQHYPLFSFEANDNWELVDSQVGTEDDAYDYYLYAYKDALVLGDEVTLFDEVKFANITDNFVNTITGEAIVDLDIKVTGYAIQSDYYNGETNDAKSAWEFYATQNDWAWPEKNYEGISTLSFVNEENVVVKTISNYVGAPVDMYFENSLAKTGYSFDWVDEATGEIAYSGMPMPEENTNLTATYTETGYGTEYSKFLEYHLNGTNDITKFSASIEGMNVNHEDYPTEPTPIVIPPYITVHHEKRSDTFTSNDGTIFYSNELARSIPEGEYKIPVTVLNHLSHDSKGITGTDEDHTSVISAVVLPDTMHTVYNISGCTAMTEAIIPYQVTTISNSFYNCTNLSKVSLPNNLKQIGFKAFQNCTALTEINIPKSVNLISDLAFSGSALTSITIPKSVTTIGVYITEPSSIQAYGAFSDCTQLETITFEDGSQLAELGDKTFKGCTSLKEISVPGTVEVIGEDTFSGCSALETVYLNEGTTTISKRAFCNCRALESIYVPSTISKVEEYAFSNNLALTDIYFAASGANNIELDQGNDKLLTANHHYNSVY